MKSIIKEALLRLGIVVMKRSSRIYVPEDDSYRIALEQCGRVNPVVIDGGAHRGATVEAFRQLAPQAHFHCFEPDPDLAAGLRARFLDDQNVAIIEAALGEALGSARFNLNASRPTNSLLETAANLQPDLQELCKTIDNVEVRLVTIDEYCASIGLDRVDIVKLDLQGYDYQALRGARRILAKTSVVLTEVFFREIYQGGHLFSDILILMRESGFELFTLTGIHYGNCDELLWADAIFIRNTSSRSIAPAMD